MSRPNILLIITDQQRRDSMSCYGSRFTSTPNIDRLATEGIRFCRAYCSNPVCTPSRISLFTGRFMSRHGAWNVGVNYPETGFMASRLFAANGYQTHYIGKAHFQAYLGDGSVSREGIDYWRRGYNSWEGPYYGFGTVELAPGHATYGMSGHYGSWLLDEVGEDQVTRWRNAKSLAKIDFGGQGYDWTIPLRYHNSVWTADRTIAFLKNYNGTSPFFLTVGFQDPHHPHAVPEEFTKRVDPADVPPPEYTPGELEDKPPHFLDAHLGRLEESSIRGEFPVAGQGKGAPFDVVTELDARQGRAYYYTLVRLIDQEVGRILDVLDDLNLVENTLVIFTSDHGELLGDHGLWMKGPFLYEQLVNVPLLMRWGGTVPANQTVSALFSLVDIMPTCLAAAGINVSDRMDGIESLKLLMGDVNAIRDSLIIETTDDPQKLRAKTIVTQNRKLTWYAGQPFGELYDLEVDPHEIVNHWNDPVYMPDKVQLMSELLNQFEPLECRWKRIAYA